MGAKKVKTTSNETATTQPNLAPYAQGPVENLFNQTGSLLGSDWTPYTAPNAILNNVFANSGNLSPGNDWIKSGLQYNTQALGGGLPAARAGTLASAELAPASMASAPGMNYASLGDPAKVDLSRALSGFSASTAEQGQQAVGAGATAGLAKDYIDYYKPYANQALVRNTMASFDDQAGRRTAAYANDAAKRGAFGGSRVAIGEAQLGADLAREGGLLRSQMEDAAYTRALDAAKGDAGNVTGASIASSQNATSASVANANNDADRMKFNAGETNKFGLLGMEGSIAAARDNAGYANQYGLAKFDAANQNNRLQYSTQADLNNANANRANDFSLARFGADNSNNQLQYQTGADVSKFNAGLGMDFNNQKLAQAAQLAQMGGLLNQGTQSAAGMQLDIGQVLQQIQNDQNMAPAEKLALIQQLLTGGGLLNSTTGQTINTNSTSTSKESGGLLQSILGAAAQVGSAAMIASDIRVKRDVELLGTEPDGLGVYRFNYVWDDEGEQPRFGVMAQEVAILRPHALGPEIDGVMTVNYGAL